MTKPTCTPKRKALAKRFKKGIEDESVNGNDGFLESVRNIIKEYEGENNGYSEWNILGSLKDNETFSREDLKLILATIYDKVYEADKQRMLELQRFFSISDE